VRLCGSFLLSFLLLCASAVSLLLWFSEIWRGKSGRSPRQLSKDQIQGRRKAMIMNRDKRDSGDGKKELSN
jgi:hypothetical protein